MMGRTMLKEILQKNNFSFNKSLGQNFISDKNLLNGIVSDSGITSDDVVVEIGTGAGTLTKALCEKAKKVISFEVDERLRPVIVEMLTGYNNYELYFEDILKMSDDKLAELIGKDFKVVANLPYYITTPLIMRFIESDYLNAKSLTFMVQKEVAERLCATENTPEYGAITLSVKLRGDASITRFVDKKVFYPIPKVDSAVVRIDINDKYSQKDIKKVLKLIKTAFAMRRKTLVNNITASYNLSKERAKDIMTVAGLDEKIRGEALDLEQFIILSDKLS